MSSQEAFARLLQDVSKTSSKRLPDLFVRRLQEPLAIMPWRRLGRKEMLHWRGLQYVFTKTNVCWEYKTNTFLFNKIILSFFRAFKAGLTLNDLYDTICMTHNSQLVFRFSLRLHFHTSCPYRVHKRCLYRVLSLQEFQQNELRASSSSSSFREKHVKEKGTKKEKSVWNRDL